MKTKILNSHTDGSYGNLPTCMNLMIITISCFQIQYLSYCISAKHLFSILNYYGKMHFIFFRFCIHFYFKAMKNSFIKWPTLSFVESGDYLYFCDKSKIQKYLGCRGFLSCGHSFLMLKKLQTKHKYKTTDILFITRCHLKN